MKKMKIEMEFYGGGQEVGRSCIGVKFSGKTKTRVLLDCGMKPGIGNAPNLYPLDIKRPREIKAVFLSHMHIDHIGGLPLLCAKRYENPIICTDIVRQGAEMLLYDSFDLEKKKLGKHPYSPGWIVRALYLMHESWQGTINEELNYRLIPNPHIPGAVSVFFEHHSRSLLYTGDGVFYDETRLMSAPSQLPKAEILMVDSTYGDKIHPDRHDTEEKFEKVVKATIARGGSVLIASLAVARSQEIMLLLSAIKPDGKIYLDGMARGFTNLFLRHIRSLKNDQLANTVEIHKVYGDNMRQFINSQTGAIIITSSAMLTGGTILTYLDKILADKKSSLIFVSYQMEGTPGRSLIDSGLIKLNNVWIRPECQVVQFNFSTHPDKIMIEKTIDQVEPKIIIAQHGELKPVKAVAAMCKKKGIVCFTPRTGDTVQL